MNDELTQELEALTTADLESIAGTHFMFSDVCPPEIRKQIRNKQAAAQEIMDSREAAGDGSPRSRNGSAPCQNSE